MQNLLWSVLLVATMAGLGGSGCAEKGAEQANVSDNEPLVAAVVMDTPRSPAPEAVVLDANEKVFEVDIERFEEMERESPTAPGGILFTGSSSIRKWSTLEADMAPLPVTNRGFGGSTLRQVHAYASRIIFPLQPSLIVLYCGENDIANDQYPAESAVEDFQQLIDYLQYHLPETPLIYLSMKPSPARWGHWPKFRAANAEIQRRCARSPLLTYVEVSEVMLLENGAVDRDIFVQDRLHLNAEGYRRWTELVRPVVESVYVP